MDTSDIPITPGRALRKRSHHNYADDDASGSENTVAHPTTRASSTRTIQNITQPVKAPATPTRSTQDSFDFDEWGWGPLTRSAKRSKTSALDSHKHGGLMSPESDQTSSATFDSETLEEPDSDSTDGNEPDDDKDQVIKDMKLELARLRRKNQDKDATIMGYKKRVQDLDKILERRDAEADEQEDLIEQ